MYTRITWNILEYSGISLYTQQKMTAQDLHSMTQEVIKTVTAAGYNIVAILSDDNVTNRKMFMELSGTPCLS